MPQPNADLVSVIIPTYNRVALLLQAIESVRRQTWPHIQILVADDGSDDDTRAMVEPMPDVCYLRQEKQGQASARNMGLRHAEGAYICTLDSDDLWHPEFLENGIHALRTLKVDFVFSNWVGETINGDRFLSYLEKLFEWGSFRETELADWRVLDPQQTRAIYIEACLSPSSSLILPRKLIVKEWVETLRIGDDWCLLLDIVLKKPCRIAMCTRRLWVKRVDGNNICDQRDFMEVKRDLYIHDSFLMLRRFFSVLTPQERALLYGRLAANHVRLARGEQARRHTFLVPGLYFRAIVYLLKAVFYSPGIVHQRFRRINPHRRAVAALELTASVETSSALPASDSERWESINLSEEPRKERAFQKVEECL